MTYAQMTEEERAEQHARYEARLAQERAEKEARRQAHFRLGDDVAAELGLGWRAVRPEQDFHNCQVELVSADDHRLAMSTIDYGAADRGKVVISGVMPRDAYRVMRDAHTSIKVTASRGARAIAREIRSRLLNEYEEKQHEAVAQLARRAADRAARDAAADRLVAILPGSSAQGTGPDSDGQVRVHLNFIHGISTGSARSSWGEIQLSSDGTDGQLEVRVPLETLERVLTVLFEEDRKGLPEVDIPGPDVLVIVQGWRGHVVAGPVWNGDMVKVQFVNGGRRREYTWAHPCQIERVNSD